MHTKRTSLGMAAYSIFSVLWLYTQFTLFPVHALFICINCTKGKQNKVNLGSDWPYYDEEK
jgi:hypothetical protein